jgi:quercetin dioxygenase-like cupin family protein
VTVNGRYPEKGYVVNEVCKEVGYVLSGSGSVCMEGHEVRQLQPGDAVLIQPREKFFWEGTALEMLMPCSPAFYPEQHKEMA